MRRLFLLFALLSLASCADVSRIPHNFDDLLVACAADVPTDGSLNDRDCDDATIRMFGFVPQLNISHNIEYPGWTYELGVQVDF